MNSLIPDLQNLVDQFREEEYVYQVIQEKYSHEEERLLGIFNILSQAIECALANYNTRLCPSESDDPNQQLNEYDAQNKCWKIKSPTMFTDPTVRKTYKDIGIIIKMYRLNPPFKQGDDGEYSEYHLQRGMIYQYNSGNCYRVENFDHIDCYAAWTQMLLAKMNDVRCWRCSEHGHLAHRWNRQRYINCTICTNLGFIDLENQNDIKDVQPYDCPASIRYGLYVLTIYNPNEMSAKQFMYQTEHEGVVTKTKWVLVEPIIK